MSLPRVGALAMNTDRECHARRQTETYKLRDWVLKMARKPPGAEQGPGSFSLRPRRKQLC